MWHAGECGRWWRCWAYSETQHFYSKLLPELSSVCMQGQPGSLCKVKLAGSHLKKFYTTSLFCGKPCNDQWAHQINQHHPCSYGSPPLHQEFHLVLHSLSTNDLVHCGAHRRLPRVHPPYKNSLSFLSHRTSLLSAFIGKSFLSVCGKPVQVFFF